MAAKDASNRFPKFKAIALAIFCLLIVSAGGTRFAAAKDAPALRQEFEIFAAQEAYYPALPWVWIKVGDSEPIKALLDTGAVGLLVFDSQLKSKPKQRLGRTFSYEFASGETLSGHFARDQITIGLGGASRLLTFGDVEKTTCAPGHKFCGAKFLKPSEYGLAGGGVANKGFKAVLGIGPETYVLPNIFVESGYRSWIVELQDLVAKKRGRIVLGPEKSDSARYDFLDAPLLAIGTGSKHRMLRLCIEIKKPSKTLCGTTLLDTGAAPYGQVVVRDKSLVSELGGIVHSTLFAPAHGDPRGISVEIGHTTSVGETAFGPMRNKDELQFAVAGPDPFYKY